MNTLIIDKRIALNTSDLLINTKSYLINMDLKPENYYLWKSGIKAPVYCNCRNLTSWPQESEDVVNNFVKLIKKSKNDFDSIIGIETAGIAWAARIASKLNLPYGYIRKKPKSHGIISYVEGNFETNNPLIVDDLVATGGSIIEAAEHLIEEKSPDSLSLISIVNWDFKKMHNLLDLVFDKIMALTSYKYIVETAKNNNLVTEIQENNLIEFYQSPNTFNTRRFYYERKSAIV